ncbi:MAG: hypothetical protein PHO30_05680 [Candidatus Omnitrophica bacterium]|nr:hypothetical protein [Candidatus Omnitrophota bacterium]
MRKFFTAIGIFISIGFFVSGCGTAKTAIAKEPAPSGPPPGCEVAVNLNAISFNFLKQDTPVRFKVSNTLGYYYAGARSDLGFNPWGNKSYSIRYKLDEALSAVSELLGKYFNLVTDSPANVPTIELTITGFSGNTLLDGRISGDQNWVINDDWRLNLTMRLLDANGEVVNGFSSAQTYSTQRRWTSSSSWVGNKAAVEKILNDALNDVIPKFFTDSKIRTALLASAGTAFEAKDVTAKAEEAERNGNLQEAFNLYMQSLSQGPINRDIIARILGICRTIKPAPVIPEEARKQASYGKAALDLAKDESGYFNAIQEYQKAIRLAPWWTDLYINTALIMEKAGLYGEAVEYLNLYLLAVPQAPDAEKIRAKLYELEYKARQTGND